MLSVSADTIIAAIHQESVQVEPVEDKRRDVIRSRAPTLHSGNVSTVNISIQDDI